VSEKSRRQQLEEMLADEPDDPFLRYGLAMEHLSAGETDTAVRCFQDLLEVASEYVPAYVQLGQTLGRLGRTSDAADVYRRGIAVARRQGEIHAAEEMQGFLMALE
jgi:Tfp pilus assembly protein PilF